TFPKLWNEVTSAVSTFYQDLKEHQANEEVVILMFTEFGRRVKENGSGTDHGSGGVAFVIGDAVKGGLYGEYPSLKPEKLDEGDLQWNNDFRSTYATLLEQWMGLDSKAILGGSLERFDFIKGGQTTARGKGPPPVVRDNARIGEGPLAVCSIWQG